MPQGLLQRWAHLRLLLAVLVLVALHKLLLLGLLALLLLLPLQHLLTDKACTLEPSLGSLKRPAHAPPPARGLCRQHQSLPQHVATRLSVLLPRSWPKGDCSRPATSRGYFCICGTVCSLAIGNRQHSQGASKYVRQIYMPYLQRWELVSSTSHVARLLKASVSTDIDFVSKIVLL